MSHPNQIDLALFAGGDLGLWNRWRVRRHLSTCAACTHEVEALRGIRGEVLEQAIELPDDLNWNRLADEMTGNIRVGLAAGEAIARFDRPSVRVRPGGLGWNAAAVLACATVVFVAAFWMSLPQTHADHLIAAFQRIRTERIGTLPQHAAAALGDVVIEASQGTIELRENGRAMSLTNPRSDGATVSVSMRGSAGVRYVDADTGQVTTNKVYYAEP